MKEPTQLMTTEQNTEQSTITEIDDEVTTELQEAEVYTVPVLTVTASLPPTSGEEYGGSLRMEAFPGDWASSGGDVAVVAEAMSRAAAQVLEQRQAGVTQTFTFNAPPVPRGVVERIYARARAANERPSAQAAEAALARAERDARQCASDHRALVGALRDLVLQAREDKAAADRAAEASAEAEPGTGPDGDDRVGEAAADDGVGQGTDGGDR